ncbi:hypothetical protein E7Z59_00545 [Robertkochia marina]|uniref:Uncharacterized protein n=1 Tax=Robertkochia marina TaxID=1227945 RepID=A0A4S3M195_9FLAO|nr:hypothetical protein [Robertkochia marina]THD68852.1 hypothetical protein E7Z59_00545 [Robertkochia marina]TRZ43926.1 hypothetical protein D3A96_10200 [Robertkochia marina]
MIKKIFVVVAMLALTAGFAQDASVSPYSYFGTGDLRFKGMVENRMMGGVSVFADSVHMNIKNPAALSKLRLTNFSVAVSNRYLSLETEETTESAGQVNFDYLTLGFPLARRLAVQFGVLPFSSTDYNLRSLNQDNDPIELNRFSGNGGINKVFFSAGWGLTRNISIGATVNYNFGTIERTASRQLDGVQYASRESSVSEYNGWDYNLALHYQGKLSENLQLQTAFTFAPEANLTSENFTEISTIFVNASGNEQVRERFEVDLEAAGLDNTKVNRPYSYSAALGIGKPYTWFVGGQYEFTKSSDFVLEYPLNVLGTYEDGQLISVGGFWIPDYDSLTSYWKRATYRLGVKTEDTGLLVNGNSLRDFGMTLGVGLPLGGFSDANIGVELGRRGELSNGGIQENYINVFISLSLSDRWFVKSLIR